MIRAILRSGLVAALVCGVVASAGSAAAAVKKNCCMNDKICLRYVADPNDPAKGSTAVDIQQVLAVNEQQVSQKPGNTFYTDPKLARFRALVKLLGGGKTCRCNQPGCGQPCASDPDLFQKIVQKVVGLTDRWVRVYLINDSAGIADAEKNNSILLYGISVENDGGKDYASPCTLCDWEPGKRNCSISTGIHLLSDTGSYPTLDYVLETFCHELMHTQDLSASRTHIYGIYRYGSDREHCFLEAIPDMASTYQEGLANLAGHWYNKPAADMAINWFLWAGVMVVEKKTPPGLDPKLFLYDKLKAAGVPETNDPLLVSFIESACGKDAAKNYAFYKMKDLPAYIIRQSEEIIALILYYQARDTSFDRVMDCVKQVNPKVDKHSTSAFAQLIQELCVQGAIEGKPPAREDLLPLALCDYFTLFRSKDEADFAGLFDGLLDQSLISDYFKVRGSIKAMVKTGSPGKDDIANIALALGITPP